MVSTCSAQSDVSDECLQLQIGQNILNQCKDFQSCYQVCLFTVNTSQYLKNNKDQNWSSMINFVNNLNCADYVTQNNMQEVYAWKNAMNETFKQIKIKYCS